MRLPRFVWRRSLLLLAGILCALAAPSLPATFGQAPAAAELDAEMARRQQIADRFLSVLERNPRRGTALDKVYGYHVENGTLDGFLKQLRERLEKAAGDGPGWMILGLLESDRSRDAAAVEAFTKASELRPTDPLGPYYLGQSLVLVGQPEKAVAAFEEAIGRKPAQADLLEIFQALGRVHQRAQRTKDALEVWDRLERLFPGDLRVQEQIAVTLAEEGQLADALPRYEALTRQTTDDYRRTMFRMEGAELKVKLNRKSDAIADLEQLLGKLNPENWLFREVRRKLEEVFLRTGDQDGLAKYYVAWIEKNADDVEAMGRLARVLARQARVPEAQEWLNKALQLAPSRKDLRLAFIEQLVDDQRYAEAIVQYAELDKTDPNNPDYLRDWGKLILRDSAGTKEEREQRAEKVWRRLVAARPTDPLTATQAADLFRSAEMQPQALALYQKAVELAPASPQYREYLGEYFHILKRPEEALATWRQMAAGTNRTAANIARLAEVLAQFEYFSDAVAEIATACQLDPKDFLLWLKAADLQIRASELDAALQSLGSAAQLAQNDEERDAVLAQQIKTYMLQEKLAELAAGLTEKANSGGASHETWFLIARYREALREFPEATRSIGEALKLAPSDIRSLSASARIAEQAGDLKNASDLSRRLAIVDRRNRSEHLQRVAQLEAQLGRPDEALAAGNELIAAAPGNTDSYQFFADLCFRLNRSEEGLAALRRAVRVNPNEPSLLLSLAAALAGQFRTDEAIELYWQAFERNARIEDRLNVIGKLTDLYLQSDKFEQLLERLERGRREADRRREMTICIAQAYQSAGDFGLARQELERLLSESSRDTQLLLQLSKLAEGENDFPVAVRYQEQLAKLAPGSETEYRLANLLSRAGSNQEAAAILVRLAAKEEDKEKLLKSIDSLLTNGQEETALASVALKLRETPGDWELIYRYGVSLAKRQPQEARRQFEALLTLPLDDWELSTTAKSRQRKSRFSSTSQTALQAQPQNPISRLDYAQEVRMAAGLDPRQMYGAGLGNIWMPESVAFARMAAVGWLYRLAFAEGRGEAFATQVAKAAEAAGASQQDLWNQVYLQALRGNFEMASSAQVVTTRRLAERGDAAGQYAYLTHLTNNRPLTIEMLTNPGEDSTPPLPPGDLALAMQSLRSIRQRLTEPGQSTEYMLSYFQQALFRELMRAGRKDEAEQFIREAIESAHTPNQVILALEIPAYRGDRETVLAVFDRFAREDLARNDNRAVAGIDFRQQLHHLLSLAVGNTKVQPPEALEIADRFLAYHIARTNQQRSDRLAALRRQMNMNNQGLLYWIGPSARRANSPLPATSSHFNDSALSVVRTAFEQFHRRDLVSDFVEHFEAKRRAASAAEQVYYTLLLAHLHVWNDDTDTALSVLAEALALASQDVELRLDVARFHLQLQQLDEALAMVDAVMPLDQRVLQQREMLALDLAVRLADQPRALAAARRLYGLRLDAQTQMQVAAQMQRLGMHTEAEAVLARAQRQIGSRVNALVNVMSQHQSDGRMELAVEVATQILRRTHTPPLAQLSLGVQSSDASYRRAALACLAQGDKLKEMIAAAEAQLARMPNSEPLLATLLEYYPAANDVEKGLDLRRRLVELHPEEPRWRFTYASELHAQGKAPAACDEFLLALKKSPGLISDYSPVLQAFKQAKREGELATLLRDFDVHGIVDPGIAIQIVQTLLSSEEARAASLEMLRHVWDAIPIYRRHLLYVLSQDHELWKTPEIFDLVVEGLMPTADSMREGPWHGLEVVRYEPRGRITSWLGMLLDVTQANGRFAEVRDAVAKAVAAEPHWLAGPPILAIIDLRLSRPVDASSSFASLLRTNQSDYTLRNARWVAAQEIGDRQELQPLALELLNRAAGDEIPGNYYRFSFGPGEALVRASVAAGRRDEARRALGDALKPRRDQMTSDPTYAGLRIRDLLAIGQLAQELGFPAEGVRAYSELLAAQDANEQLLTNWTGRTLDQLRREAQRGLTAITSRLGSAEKTQLVLALLTPAADAEEGAGPIDLSITLAPAIGPLGKIESLLDRLLRRELLASPAARAIDDELAKLAALHPRSLSIDILRTLIALRRDDAAATRQAVDRLTRIVGASPLDELARRQRPNSRLRRQASEQIGLWLVSRECAGRPDCHEAAEHLAERSIEAARRQLEPQRLAAILYERGLEALQAGDPPRAEREWNWLIELALVEPRTPKSGAAAGKSRGPLPATITQFNLAAALSQAAAEKNLAGVSLRAMHAGLSGGLPVADLTKSQLASMAPRNFRSPNNNSARTDLDINVAAEVQKRIAELSRVWRQHHLPPAEVSEVLQSLVLPASRAENVMLFEQNTTSDWTSPKSVGRILADWAVLAHGGDEIRRQIEARRATPTDALAGEVLAFQLDLAAGDRAAAREHLALVATQLEGAKTMALANTAVHAAGLAMADRQLADAALPVLSQIASLPARQVHQELLSLVEFLARERLARDDVASAKAEVERYLTKRQQHLARFSDDSGLTLRRQDLAWAATELARAGETRLTLEFLGRFADAVRSGSGEEQLAACCWLLQRQLARLPAAERYALLREWTMPAEGRRALRLVGAFCQPQPPAAVATPTSNFGLLVTAAAEAGTLAELATAVEPLTTEKIAGAAGLLALIQLAQGLPAAAAQTLDGLVTAAEQRGLEQERKLAALRPSAQPPVPNAGADERKLLLPVDWSEYLVARAALRSPATEPLGRRLAQSVLKQAQRVGNTEMMTHIALDLGPLPQGSNVASVPRLTHWLATASPATELMLPAPAWRTNDGSLEHIAGNGHDALVFRYPLAGTFEFSCEVSTGKFAQADIGYGGLLFMPEPWTGNVQIDAVSQQDRVTRTTDKDETSGWRRLSIRVSPQSLQFYYGDKLVFEDTSPSGTSPWLQLAVLHERQATIKNVELRGEPVIPRAVKLIDNDRLDGWTASSFNERLPARISLAEVPPDNQQIGYVPPAEAAKIAQPPDWTSEGGELTGRVDPLAESTSQSWLSYHRPLLNGESLSYEFLYEPGFTHVHPSLGQMAFMLSEQGVLLHQIAKPNSGTEPIVFDPRNITDEPACRRGPEVLPLLQGAWNVVELSLTNHVVRIKLNDELIFERPVDQGGDHRFGLFHYKAETEARVRNVVLTGPWPQSVELGAVAAAAGTHD